MQVYENRKVILIALSVMTIAKIVVILLFYQKIYQEDGGEWRIISGYTWDTYIEAIESGSYTIPPQNRLEGIVKHESSAYRPPVFPYLMYAMHKLRSVGPIIPVALFSIITSLISYLSYLLVVQSGARTVYAVLSMLLVFIFPMNFLKSGVIDEASIMLLALLASIYCIQKSNIRGYALGGMFAGLAMMTRFTGLLAIVPVIAALLWKRQLHAAIVVSVLMLVVTAPWLIRNYIHYEEIVLSTGGARFAVITLSEEFIKKYPYVSIDEIEIEYFKRSRSSYEYMKNMSELEREREYTRLAREKIAEDPSLLLSSLARKLLVYAPIGYLPRRGDVVKDIVYTTFYLVAIVMLFHNILSRNMRMSILWLAALGYASQGILFAMTSRHMYPVIAMAYIAYFSGYSANGKDACRAT